MYYVRLCELQKKKKKNDKSAYKKILLILHQNSLSGAHHTASISSNFDGVQLGSISPNSFMFSFAIHGAIEMNSIETATVFRQCYNLCQRRIKVAK